MIRATRQTTTHRTSTRFTVAWVALAIIGVATLAFGLIAALVPASSDALYLRADGVALVGMGLFGTLITAMAYRRRERWAWLALWYYPPLLGGAPAGQLAARHGPRAPGRLHRPVARGPAPSRARLLPHGSAQASMTR